jgi:hypothetical protein
VTRIEAAMHLDGCHFFVWVAQDGQLTFDERQGQDLYLHSMSDCPRCTALKRGATPLHERRKVELPEEPKSAFMSVLVAISDIPGVSDETNGGGEDS